jgi:hypothetical protein
MAVPGATVMFHMHFTHESSGYRIHGYLNANANASSKMNIVLLAN